jgi:t-SNARE complex subunit (syntaxin)
MKISEHTSEWLREKIAEKYVLVDSLKSICNRHDTNENISGIVYEVFNYKKEIEKLETLVAELSALLVLGETCL